MLRYVANRFVGMAVTIFIASIISFAAIELPSGSYLSTYRAQLQSMDLDAEQIETQVQYIEERFALSQPTYVRYLVWVGYLVKGDFGYSLAFRASVSQLIGDRFAMTAVLAISAAIYTFVLGLVVGVIAALKPYSLIDNFLTLVAFIFLAVPSFLLGIIVIYVWVTAFGGAPQFGLQSNEYIFAPWGMPRILDLLAHLWLPVVIIGTGNAAAMIRIVRARMLEALPEPYVQTARMKGLRERRVVLIHALRVAINPVISATALSLPTLIGGEIITSIVLQLPTIGPLLFAALMSQDMYLAATILLIMTVVLVFANFVADLIIAWLDPRVTYG